MVVIISYFIRSSHISVVHIFTLKDTDSCFGSAAVAAYNVEPFPCYSLAAKKPVNQSVSSTCCNPESYLNLKYGKVAQFCAILFYWTRIYPMDLMDLSPLSAKYLAAFPHVLESSGFSPVPNPILELQVWQSLTSLPRKPTLALERSLRTLIALNPSLLQ